MALRGSRSEISLGALHLAECFGRFGALGLSVAGRWAPRRVSERKDDFRSEQQDVETIICYVALSLSIYRIWMIFTSKAVSI